ncbi:MAG: FYDLN acid domain-containing protein, partial [Alphaproteobacteria bacterium]
MAKPEWGVKRTCQECDAKFYDMCREKLICPKCEAVFV